MHCLSWGIAGEGNEKMTTLWKCIPYYLKNYLNPNTVVKHSFFFLIRPATDTYKKFTISTEAIVKPINASADQTT